MLVTLFALCTAVPLAAQAQGAGFSPITTEKIAELESMHEQAIDFLLKNDFQGAVRTYSDILLMEPDDETAYTGLGQIYMIQGRYKLAHESFKNALDINPDNQVALAGVRKIMDPDGLEGMTSKTETETEPYLKPAAIKPAPMRARIVPAPQADISKRQSAAKVKKGYLSPKPAELVQKPVPVFKNKPVNRLGRVGLLHAQRMQMALKKAGFYSGPVNGMIGGSTKSAVRDFQKQFGIVPSGRMTSVTWDKLSQYLSR